MFGDQAIQANGVPYLDDFGRYIIIRQKKIYEAFCSTEERASHIYNGRASKLFRVDKFDHLVKERKDKAPNPNKQTLRDIRMQALEVDWNVEAAFKDA